jgi:hypothetical protein
LKLILEYPEDQSHNLGENAARISMITVAANDRLQSGRQKTFIT